MAKIKGVCKNIDDCTKAQDREIQEVEKTMPFVCEECEKPLVKVEGKTSGGTGGGGNKNMLIAIMAAVVLIGGGAGVYFGFIKSSGEKTVTVVPPDKPEPEVGPKEVNIESISLDKSTLEMAVNDTDTLKATLNPTEAKAESLEWASGDTKIATVENGVVKAIGKGETTITIKDTKGIATASSQIKVSEISKDPGSGQGGGSSSGQLSYGKWTGGTKNGKPHGTQITFTFTTSHQIDSRDPKKRIANAGDYIIGEYDNGRLVQGRWYKSSGGFESVMIGK